MGQGKENSRFRCLSGEWGWGGFVANRAGTSTGMSTFTHGGVIHPRRGRIRSEEALHLMRITYMNQSGSKTIDLVHWSEWGNRGSSSGHGSRKNGGGPPFLPLLPTGG